MVVTIDATNSPWIHISGTTAEVLGKLKADHAARMDVVSIWYNGTNTSCVYRRGPGA